MGRAAAAFLLTLSVMAVMLAQSPGKVLFARGQECGDVTPVETCSASSGCADSGSQCACLECINDADCDDQLCQTSTCKDNACVYVDVADGPGDQACADSLAESVENVLCVSGSCLRASCEDVSDCDKLACRNVVCEDNECVYSLVPDGPDSTCSSECPSEFPVPVCVSGDCKCKQCGNDDECSSSPTEVCYASTCKPTFGWICAPTPITSDSRCTPDVCSGEGTVANCESCGDGCSTCECKYATCVDAGDCPVETCKRAACNDNKCEYTIVPDFERDDSCNITCPQSPFIVPVCIIGDCICANPTGECRTATDCVDGPCNIPVCLQDGFCAYEFKRDPDPRCTAQSCRGSGSVATCDAVGGECTCEECVTAADCPSPAVCSSETCDKYKCSSEPVSVDPRCTGSTCTEGSGSVATCAATNGVCTCEECVTAADCPEPPFCFSKTCDNYKCSEEPVSVDPRCTGSTCARGDGPAATCEAINGTCICVQCATDADCPAAPICRESKCDSSLGFECSQPEPISEDSRCTLNTCVGTGPVSLCISGECRCTINDEEDECGDSSDCGDSGSCERWQLERCFQGECRCIPFWWLPVGSGT